MFKILIKILNWLNMFWYKRKYKHLEFEVCKVCMVFKNICSCKKGNGK